jgi:hypothetical protein
MRVAARSCLRPSRASLRRIEDAVTLGSLDYLYTPSANVAADLRYLVDVLGLGEVFAIEDGGIRVAMVATAAGSPAILLTDHLEGDRPIHLFAVESLAAASAELESRGWKAERSVDLPPGPAITFRTPGGLRLAIYEPSRPFVVESFRGRRDFGQP